VATYTPGNNRFSKTLASTAAIFDICSRMTKKHLLLPNFDILQKKYNNYLPTEENAGNKRSGRWQFSERRC
jgi:hypothetical protein